MKLQGYPYGARTWYLILDFNAITLSQLQFLSSLGQKYCVPI
jgi:hypothetical protein